jgi:hypothetical protein
LGCVRQIILKILRHLIFKMTAMTPPDQLSAIVTPGALATPIDTSLVVPALIADLGDAANWRYVEFFTANINNDHTRRAYARACSRFFCLVRKSRALAHEHPAVRRCGLGERPPAATRVAGCETAARCGTHAVRLAGDGPDRAHEPSRCSARTETCGQDR